jgi:excisionase family DNA binding protein
VVSGTDSIDEIGITEAAEICGLSVQTMYKYLNQGKLNIVVKKRGKEVRMNRADIMKWNASRYISQLR